MDGIGGIQRSVANPTVVEPLLDRHLLEQFGGQPVRLVIHRDVEHQVQGASLLIRGDRLDRVEIHPLRDAIDGRAADPVSGDRGRLAVLAEKHFIGTSGLHPAFTLVDHVFEDAGSELGHQSDL